MREGKGHGEVIADPLVDKAFACDNKFPEPRSQCTCLVRTNRAESLPLFELTEKVQHQVRAEASLGEPFVDVDDVSYPQTEEHQPC